MNSKEMLSLIEQFPSLVVRGYSLTKPKLLFDSSKIKNIVYAGMGGSALAGDVIKELLYSVSSLPMEVVRGYSLPGYVSRETFVIISSFSGNTEETIECFKDAVRRKAKIIAVSSGGEVERMAKKSRSEHIKLPVDMPPRTAFGMTLFSLLRKIEALTGSGALGSMAEDAVSRMDAYQFDYSTAKSIAKLMKGRIPLFYTDSSFSSVGRRCANQVSENAKQFAHFNVIPEMNHNEIVGLEMPKNLRKNLMIFFISFVQEAERNKKREMITKSIADKAGFETLSIEFCDANPVYNVIDSMILFDLASYYLSVINRVDAVKIERINILKGRMGR